MFTTTRITLRELKLTDIENIHQLHSLPETDEYNTLGIPASIHITKKIVAEWFVAQKQTIRETYVFAIELNANNSFIGLIGLKIGKQNYRTAEVWFKIHKDFWSKGYTTEALIRILEFGFNNLNLHRIEAGCAVENVASSRVLEKVGLTREGTKRKKLPIRGEWKDNYFYAILEEDFSKGI